MRSTTPAVRELSSEELHIIGRLLEPQFPGAPELREQAGRSAVRLQDYGGVVVFAFETPAGVTPARVEQRIPVEAEAADADGVTIHFLLHVIGGVLKEVEVFREDSEPIRRFPRSAQLQILVN
jgi:hypothetical protein